MSGMISGEKLEKLAFYVPISRWNMVGAAATSGMKRFSMNQWGTVG
jgi:hypothetical protein